MDASNNANQITSDIPPTPKFKKLDALFLITMCLITIILLKRVLYISAAMLNNQFDVSARTLASNLLKILNFASPVLNPIAIVIPLFFLYWMYCASVNKTFFHSSKTIKIYGKEKSFKLTPALKSIIMIALCILLAQGILAIELHFKDVNYTYIFFIAKALISGTIFYIIYKALTEIWYVSNKADIYDSRYPFQIALIWSILHFSSDIFLMTSNIIQIGKYSEFLRVFSSFAYLVLSVAMAISTFILMDRITRIQNEKSTEIKNTKDRVEETC